LKKIENNKKLTPEAKQAKIDEEFEKSYEFDNERINYFIENRDLFKNVYENRDN